MSAAMKMDCAMFMTSSLEHFFPGRQREPCMFRQQALDMFTGVGGKLLGRCRFLDGPIMLGAYKGALALILKSPEAGVMAKENGRLGLEEFDAVAAVAFADGTNPDSLAALGNHLHPEFLISSIIIEDVDRRHVRQVLRPIGELVQGTVDDVDGPVDHQLFRECLGESRIFGHEPGPL